MQADHRFSAASFPGQEPGRGHVARDELRLSIVGDNDMEATHA